ELYPLPYETFEARNVVDASRQMQQARHIGKIVVTYRDGIPTAQVVSERSAHATANAPQLTLSDNATYLVTGGLSGFGLRTAHWLANKGARHLVLISRSGAVSEEAQTAVQDLKA